MLDTISNRIFSFCQKDLLTHSRIHRVSSFEQEGCRVYVKREDESGFGISGCKKRKYASLIPWLLQENIQRVALIGGARSNHVVSLLQLLREYRIDVQLFLKKNHASVFQGNQLLLHLLAEPEEIYWMNSQSWSEVEHIAHEQLAGSPDKYTVIPEGGTCAPALAGACSLMLDIVRNERELGQTFDHIIMDSGTGMMAGATCLTHQWLEHPSRIHVVLMAGNESYFASQLSLFHQWASVWMDVAQTAPPHPDLYYPDSARSFGSVNKSVLHEVRHLARTEGILSDPIYTAKLFSRARTIVKDQDLKGNVLIVHSGGGTGLMGFGEKLSNL